MPPSDPKPRTHLPSCWVVTDGKPGMENQCLGLAEALGLDPEIKRIAPRFPWRALPPRLWFAALAAPGPGGDELAPPWPDLLIATGRQTAAISAAIKRTAPTVFTVQIQNPVMPLGAFDLVIAPMHDRIDGANVIATNGALHRISDARIAEAAAALAPALAHLPRPRIAVLIGGANRHYRFGRNEAEKLAAHLALLAERHGAGLMITASRRTGAENMAAITARLNGAPCVIWDGDSDGPNPYFGYLGLADALVVTGDSVNMVSEACATGKPVYVFDLPGGSAKFARFHAAMARAGRTRPFTGALDDWTPSPLNELAEVAAKVHAAFMARHPDGPARPGTGTAGAASRHGDAD